MGHSLVGISQLAILECGQTNVVGQTIVLELHCCRWVSYRHCREVGMAATATPQVLSI
jgi:hypothetical protein